jgi:hypothetical protein
MTQKEFWRLARMGRTWRVTCFGVRCVNGACPLAVVLDPEATGVCGPNNAAKVLCLPPSFTNRVARGADYPDTPDRRWLLKNLGMRS